MNKNFHPVYDAHYRTAYKMFQDNFLFGVGKCIENYVIIKNIILMSIAALPILTIFIYRY